METIPKSNNVGSLIWLNTGPGKRYKIINTGPMFILDYRVGKYFAEGV